MYTDILTISSAIYPGRPRLLDSGNELIYLCEGDFNIPKSKQNLKYIELGGASVKGKATAQVVEKNVQSAADQHENDEVIVRLSGTESGFLAGIGGSLKNDLIISEVNGSNKKKVAENVTAFARYQNTLVYVEVNENSDIDTNIKTKLSIESERPHRGYIKNIFLTNTSIIWAQRNNIYLADYDGDFKEIISGTVFSDAIQKMQLRENTLYFLPVVKVETGFLGDVKYQPIYKVDLSTKRRTTLANNVHAFTVGINKVYYANMEYKVYECDLEGNAVKLLHNLEPGHRISDMNYDSGSLILHHGGNIDDEFIKVSE